jgi:hypothetical protein
MFQKFDILIKKQAWPLKKFNDEVPKLRDLTVGSCDFLLF